MWTAIESDQSRFLLQVWTLTNRADCNQEWLFAGPHEARPLNKDYYHKVEFPFIIHRITNAVFNSSAQTRTRKFAQTQRNIIETTRLRDSRSK
jgi:hypothetical protein